ncbi:hypothetical protein AC579_3629 [Pseudocercospora musae]|uniref:Uncharacterized protein n=1 Tax=Pseudocercospora musae TaxID=113226 RepID=A0A139ISZ4_9PEZI|nr:hypothetical protein AC579_3629 [Pseudocercospora musae]
MISGSFEQGCILACYRSSELLHFASHGIYEQRASDSPVRPCDLRFHDILGYNLSLPKSDLFHISCQQPALTRAPPSLFAYSSSILSSNSFSAAASALPG